MPLELAHLLPCRQIPHAVCGKGLGLGLGFQAASGQLPSSFRADGHAIDVITVSLELARLLAGRHIPHAGSCGKGLGFRVGFPGSFQAVYGLE